MEHPEQTTAAGARPVILQLDNVSKAYGATLAVNDISLQLREGEFLTFLGPSGSGKTTTLAMVAGLQWPTRGSILLNGSPLDPLPAYRRNIGMVFQNYALFPHMTVAGNIAFPLEMRRIPAAEIRHRVGEVLELVGLPEYGERYPRQLSGGQQQRVALARAMVFRPPLLLMDEPLGALDKKLREQMQLEILRLHRELKMSVLYVTHDQEEALVMSDRIAVFNRGRIEQIGGAEEIYERPETRFVAGFLGDSNFFSGTVTSAVGAFCLVASAQGPIKASNAARLGPGDRAVVAVRPERIRISTNGKADGDGNVLKGRVTDIIYLGQSRKYVLKMACGAEVVVLEQARGGDQTSAAPGDELTLTWSGKEASALAETDTAR
jgi:putative spermidine/putrescine transport system ATP-binding protein